MKQMKSAVMNRIGSFDIESRPLPVPKDDQVLVQLDYVGICGSDSHLFANGYIGESHVTEPMVLGHEPAGVVAAVGKDVTHLKVGDRVTIEPGVPCWQCDFCREGKYNLCPNVYFYASLPVTEGCFAEYIAHSAALCYRLPDNVSTLEGALIEPLAVGYHAVAQSGARTGASAVILGAGCIGLTILLALRNAGIRHITMVDMLPNRLEKAMELGATHIVNASQCDSIAEVQRITNGRGADFVFEAAGNETTMLQSAKMARRGGVITLVGYTSSGLAKLNVNWLIDNEITIKTAFRYRHHYPAVVEAIADGTIPAKALATDIFDFSEIQKGMEYAINHKDTVIKAIIRINPNA